MKTRNLLLIGFVVMVLIQWAVPGLMIFDQEDVRRNGTAFHFRTAPVDPYDPFRGKYVFLNFEDEMVELASDEEEIYSPGETVYALISEDTEGFAKVTGLSKSSPADTPDYVKVVVGYAFQDSMSTQRLHLDFPFNTFYMEESKAYPAEQIYRESATVDSLDTYAVVRIKNGAYSLVDVIVDEVSLRERVLMEREKEVD